MIEPGRRLIGEEPQQVLAASMGLLARPEEQARDILRMAGRGRSARRAGNPDE